MGRFSSIGEEIQAGIAELKVRLQDVIIEEMDEADRKTYEAYSVIEQEKAEEVFKKAVTEFYSAYNPHLYKREGDVGSESGGLYELFKLDLDNDNMVVTDDPTYSNLFDASKMHGGRNIDGAGLFDQVFMHGWHGGASSIDGGKADVWGAHPSPGVPHYRKRGKVRYPDGTVKWHKYGKWGRQAVHSAPPAKLFQSYFSAAEDGELQDEFDRIDEEEFNKAMERIAARQSELEDEIFG